MAAPEIPATQIVEPAGVEALWGLPLQAAGCSQCGQAHLVDASRIGQPCPACAHGRLAPQPARLRPEPPELILPFRASQLVNAALEQFVRGVWLRPDDFSVDSLRKRITPVYWPMWLVDSDLSGDWQAETGFDYQVKSSQESYAGGSWQTQEKIETRIRWEPRMGFLHRHYENVAVPALSEHANLMKVVGGYQVSQAVPYSASEFEKELRASALRIPDLQPASAWTQALSSLDAAAGEECRQAASAQHVRSYAIHGCYERLHWTQLLLPAYVTFYTDDNGQPHLVFINGQSGVIGGKRIASQRRGWQWAGVSFAASLLVFLLAVVFLAVGAAFVPLILLGLFAGFVGLALMVFAVVAAAWPWHWNRGQQEAPVRTK